MNFLDHLEALRWHLVRSVVTVLLFSIAAFIFHDFVFDNLLLGPRQPSFPTNKLLCRLGELTHVSSLCINAEPLRLININMAGQFSIHITISLLVGFIAGFPYLLFEMWRFIKPALYGTEVKQSRGFIVSSSLLFTLGVLFGYYVITPLSIHFLGTYHVSSQVTNQINLKSYVSSVSSITLAAGFIFELPILIYFLSKMGITSPEMLRKYRRHSLVAILAVSAIITPPDIFSQILVALPLLVLYEVGIVVSRKVYRN